MKKTLELVIKQAQEKHNNFYTYPLDQEYKGNKSKIRIICPVHGEFEQQVGNHLSGKGCMACGNLVKNRLNLEQVRENLKTKHGDKFDYDLSEYKNTKSKIKIFCKRHQEWFEQVYEVHLRSHGCSKCSKEAYTLARTSVGATNFFERESKRFPHLDFSDSEYVNACTKIKYRCSFHGEMEALPDSISRSSTGCRLCGIEAAGESRLKQTSAYIEEAKGAWGCDFDYSKTVYTSHNDLVTVKCNQCQREFQVTALKHLQRGNCKYCNESSGEAAVRRFLETNNIEFNKEHKFEDCVNIKPLKFDFYIAERNLIVEYDGIQHYEEVDIFGGKAALEYTQKNDEIKNTYAADKGINLIRVKYDEDIDKVLNQKLRPRYHKIKKELSSFFPLGAEFDIETDNFVLDVIGFDIEYDRNYLLERQKLTEKKYIPMFQSEWEDKKHIVLSRLNNYLGLSNKIHGRQTKVKTLDYKTVTGFLNENHIQGSIKGKHYLGLYYKEDLVLVAVFGSLRKNLGQKHIDGHFELLRLCSKLGFSVVGGGSKIIKAFKDYKQIISYCDLRWGTGKLYENIGFSQLHKTAPNYFYTDGDKIYNRFSFRKDRLVNLGHDKSKSEKQITKELGYKVIYDLGSLKYTKV